MDIQKAGVQYIIDSVVRALQKSPDRRFIYVETAFFWKWWKEQNESTRTIVKGLVQSGQLEFISGGWSMNDEAASHYNSIIDQMTWGFRRLKDTFGSCGIPKIGWQIDPFGHSREQASLFAQMNFDALFFGRLDYEDKKERENSKTLEMVWSGSDDLGSSSSLFTHVMDKGYGTPHGFCYDIVKCNDDPFFDDPKSPDYNVDRIIRAFVNLTQDMASKYVTNNILIPMGGDFTYQYALGWYKNMDKLIKYTKEKNTDINIFYSTPSCYLNSVYQSNKTFTVKTDDFFPYGSDPHSYWTGYFTSRPTTKYYERVGNNFLQICKQLDALSLLKETDDDIAKLRESMGIFQHHDAISGTEKQHVSDDYCLQLSKGITRCESVIQSALNKLITKDKISAPKQSFCRLLNTSSCDITEGKDPNVTTVYNPIGRKINQFIRLPVTGDEYSVKGPDGSDVPSETFLIPNYVLTIPGRESKSKYELQFKAEVPALGFSTYFVKSHGNAIAKDNFKPEDGKISIKGKSFTIYFDANNGAIDSIDLNGQKIALKQSIQYYKSMNGDHTKPERRASGAYAFRPDGQTPIDVGSNPKSKFIKGKSANEVQQTYSDWIGQTIRVYPDEDYIEFDWVIGPIPITDDIGKEIILRFDSDLASNKMFYTDANGRQMMKRIRDFRESWKYTVTEPVSGNYYPINSRMAIRDETKGLQLTLLSDRSQGGTSIKNGSMEIMVHRRILHDDKFGVNEALNETGIDGRGLIVRGKHYLLLSKISDAPKLHRDLAQRIFMSPLLTFANYANDYDDYRKNFVTSYSGLNAELPPNVHLLTLEQWKDSTYLLRLEHFYESKDDPNALSKPVTVQLQKLFKSFTITGVSETTLGANQDLGSRKRLRFNTSKVIKDVTLSPINTNNFTLTLNPMEIRTFIVNIKV